MNFATLQGLTIPEGVVTQITDASGRVIWKKAPSTVTITIDNICVSGVAPGVNYVYVIVDGKTYDGSTKHTLSVPIGTIVTCYASTTIFLPDYSQVYGTYYYEVTKDTSFKIDGDSNFGMGFLFIEN